MTEEVKGYDLTILQQCAACGFDLDGERVWMLPSDDWERNRCEELARRGLLVTDPRRRKNPRYRISLSGQGILDERGQTQEAGGTRNE